MPPPTSGNLEARLYAGPGDWIPLEDFAPLPRCLEWRLSRAYWNLRGPNAFFSGDVPYAAINDGRLSADTARLLLEICSGQDPHPPRVLEVGGGSGLFAKSLLDELNLLSPSRYAQTTYVWTDASPAMVQQTVASGIFTEHAARVRTQVLPVPGMSALAEEQRTGFDLIIANYLLDNLPATWLRLSPNGVEELEVRATLPAELDPVRLRGRTAAEWAEYLKQSQNPEEGLVELYPWFSLQCRYRPVVRENLKYGRLVPEPQAGAAQYWPHHEAALTWLQEALPFVRPGGGVLINDYGHSPSRDGKRFDALQHFGGSVANGVNLDELARFSQVEEAWTVVSPEMDSKQVQSRWIGRAGDKLSAGIFRIIFDGVRRDRVMDLLTQAQDCAQSGRWEEARWLFWQAREGAPRSWLVLERWSAFCCVKLRDFHSALALAEAGLTLHPRHPQLLNAKGDALYEMKHFTEAEACYRQTLELNPREVRGRLNLAYVQLERGRCAEALAVIAEALAFDTGGDFREALLEKQRQVLVRLSLDARDSLAQQLNRFRNLDAPSRPPAT